MLHLTTIWSITCFIRSDPLGNQVNGTRPTVIQRDANISIFLGQLGNQGSMLSIHPLDILNFLHSKDERSDPQSDTRKIENEKVTNTNRSLCIFL